MVRLTFRFCHPVLLIPRPVKTNLLRLYGLSTSRSCMAELFGKARTLHFIGTNSAATHR